MESLTIIINLWTYIFHMHPHSTTRLIFYCEKLFFLKVGVVTYFRLFLKWKTKQETKR